MVVATRYAALRKQFGREDKESNSEVSILNYPTSQMRIVPAFAEHLAYRIAGGDLIEKWLDAQVIKSFLFLKIKIKNKIKSNKFFTVIFI